MILEEWDTVLINGSRAMRSNAHVRRINASDDNLDVDIHGLGLMVLVHKKLGDLGAVIQRDHGIVHTIV
jgi:hypothetical protein